jgi:hypothetical protein
LISLIAYSEKDFEPLVRYYSEKDNRKAACIAAALQLKYSVIRYDSDNKTYLNKVDSLINIYNDLPECGALAIRKAYILLYLEENELLLSQAEKGKALEWIEEAIKRWPSWKEMNELRNKKEDLIAPTVNLYCKNVFSTTDTVKFELNNIRNISGVAISATPIVGYPSKDIHTNYDIEKNFKALKPYLKTSKAISITKQLEKHEIYESFKDTITIGKLPLGTYLVELITDGESLKHNKAIINVSDLKVIALQQGEKQIRYVVVNSASGHPVR